MFLVGSLNSFQELANLFVTKSNWEGKEAALFLLYHVSKSIDP